MVDTPAGGGRVAWVDAARGVAVVLMVFTHVCDAFLADSFRHGTIWYVADVLSGMAAPAFLLLAGVTLYHRLVVRGASGRAVGWQTARLLVLGYWLQIPVLSLRQLVWNQRPDELARLFNVNILQVIAVATAVALCLWAIPALRPRWFTPACAVAALAVMALTSTVWSSALSTTLPYPISSYAAPQPQTILPPFPFAAYLLAGCAIAPLLLGAQWRVHRVWVALAGGAIATGCLLLLVSRPDLAAGTYGWADSPYNAAMRLGAVLVLAVGCMGVAARWPGVFLRSVGRASLGIYLLHLVMIYGSPVNPGVARWLYRTLDPAQTAALGVVALCASCLGVWGWRQLQRRRPDAARWLAGAGVVVFLGIFLIRP